MSRELQMAVLSVEQLTSHSLITNHSLVTNHSFGSCVPRPRAPKKGMKKGNSYTRFCAELC